MPQRAATRYCGTYRAVPAYLGIVPSVGTSSCTYLPTYLLVRCAAPTLPGVLRASHGCMGTWVHGYTGAPVHAYLR